jgi:hypothetical protein
MVGSVEVQLDAALVLLLSKALRIYSLEIGRSNVPHSQPVGFIPTWKVLPVFDWALRGLSY